MDIYELLEEVQKLVNDKLGFNFDNLDGFDESRSTMDTEVKPKELKKQISKFKKKPDLDTFFMEVDKKIHQALISQSKVFERYSTAEALNKELLIEEGVLSGNILSERGYRDLVNDIQLDNEIKLTFVIQVYEEELEDGNSDSENTTYALNLEIEADGDKQVIKGGEAVSLPFASNNTTTLATWLVSNILN